MKEHSLGMKTVLALAALAASSTMCAQGGKAVTSHDGSSQVTVPSDWSVSGSFGIADSADKQVNVAVSMPRSSPTLAGLKQTAQMIYANDKVVKDTPSEFQMEGQGMSGKPNVYRGIQIPGKVCIVEVTYESGTIDDARKIAESLKSAK
jgi:hypothetical protein